MSEQQSGFDFGRRQWQIIIPLVAYLLGQSVTAFIWAVRVDYRVTSLEIHRDQFDRAIDRLDQATQVNTRSIAVGDERQKQIVERLVYLQVKADAISNYLGGRSSTPITPP